jgi:hypothetical protein
LESKRAAHQANLQGVNFGRRSPRSGGQNCTPNNNQKTLSDDDEIYAASAPIHLDTQPQVASLDLPNIWAELGRAHACRGYFVLAAQAAEAINDGAMASWAMRKAMEIDTIGNSHQTSVDEALGNTYR